MIDELTTVRARLREIRCLLERAEEELPTLAHARTYPPAMRLSMRVRVLSVRLNAVARATRLALTWIDKTFEALDAKLTR